MRVLLTTAILATLAAGPAVAQTRSRLEVGTHLGGTIAFGGGGDAEFQFGIPAPTSFLAGPALYVTIFATPGFMIEPQIAFNWNSIADDVLLNGILQLGFLMSPTATASPYFTVHGGWTTIYGEAESGLVGGGLGVRFLVKDRLAVRTEARYRRWTCSGCDLNEVGLQIGLGTALP
jgi:hypothetical protein